ncbi:response regulator [Desulfovibrio ferrophilus]|uniref:Response regulator receiver n=1 Tax=Desulfovibrio ferrophilus TaxID=241368 RepID=A0A2Z6AY16_9BACT|nr:response regulator [Desulfovibrio ferrophilus]BBD08154.1 response regulator receiver [Desulfovibrio ferrophilus]
MNKSIRVLVVDDEDRFRENIVRILNDCGLEAEGAEDGEQALNLVKEYEFDVILLDMKMPGLSGEGTLRSMRSTGIDAEVVVLTGHASVSGALSMMELGAFDYLLKPASVSEMLRKVKLAGEKKRQRNKRSASRNMKSDMD